MTSEEIINLLLAINILNLFKTSLNLFQGISLISENDRKYVDSAYIKYKEIGYIGEFITQNKDLVVNGNHKAK